MTEKYHQPVLLNETIKYLDPQPRKRYIDATLGGGGHTLALLSRGASVLGIDRDPDAIAHAREHLLEFLAACPKPQSGAPGPGSPRLTLVQGNFADLKRIATQNGFTNVSGIIFDLGVSGHQLETATRGFSFMRPGPLDMRMDPESQGVTAADLVNTLSEHDLTQLFQKFAEEPWAHPIAHSIFLARRVKPFETTDQLARVVGRVKPRKKTNPATQVFQALRIVVNSEDENLMRGLEATRELLTKGGKLVVISFQSLEDKMVKNFLKSFDQEIRPLTKKPIVPNQSEITQNPRSRSAKLRAAEKI